MLSAEGDDACVREELQMLPTEVVLLWGVVKTTDTLLINDLTEYVNVCIIDRG